MFISTSTTDLVISCYVSFLTNIESQLTYNDTENGRVTKDRGHYEESEGNIPEERNLVVHAVTFWLETLRKVSDLELRKEEKQEEGEEENKQILLTKNE